MKGFLKFLLVIVLLGVVGFGAYWTYSNFFSSFGGDQYVDEQYGFTIGDTKGWYEDYPEDGVYYSLATVDEDNLIISYFSVSPVVKDPSRSAESSLDEVREDCESLYEDLGDSNLSVADVTIGDMVGVLCQYDAEGENTEEMLVTRQYFLLNSENNQYDYFLFTSYPKGNLEEKEKVDQIVNSFLFN